jgi:hypothetical protein
LDLVIPLILVSHPDDDRGDAVRQVCFKGAGAPKWVDPKNVEGFLKGGRWFKLA